MSTVVEDEEGSSAASATTEDRKGFPRSRPAPGMCVCLVGRAGAKGVLDTGPVTKYTLLAQAFFHV